MQINDLNKMFIINMTVNENKNILLGSEKKNLNQCYLKHRYYYSL